MKTSHSTAESLRLFVRDKLRDDHPHMKSAKAEEIARRCKLFFMKQMETALPGMEEPKADFGIMSLPRNIRNRIFAPLLVKNDISDASGYKRKAFQHGRQILVADHTSRDDYQGIQGKVYLLATISKQQADKDWMMQPAVTRVSREIRSETLAMYYGANTLRTYVFETYRFDNAECRAMAQIDRVEEQKPDQELRDSFGQ